MTPKQVAARTQYSIRHVRYLIRSGRIKATKKAILGGYVYDVPESEVKRLIKKGKDNRGWNSVNVGETND